MPPPLRRDRDTTGAGTFFHLASLRLLKTAAAAQLDFVAPPPPQLHAMRPRRQSDPSTPSSA